MKRLLSWNFNSPIIHGIKDTLVGLFMIVLSVSGLGFIFYGLPLLSGYLLPDGVVRAISIFWNDKLIDTSSRSWDDNTEDRFSYDPDPTFLDRLGAGHTIMWFGLFALIIIAVILAIAWGLGNAVRKSHN